jgi:hypothetical protein
MLKGMTADVICIDDFYKAYESLKKASVPMSNLVAVQAPIETDTYTLIPNGTEITKKQGDHGVKVRAYLVQHDQSGLTIKWEGASECWYYEYTSSVNSFRTFSGWVKSKREKWYRSQYNRILTEETKKMYNSYYDNCECDLCVPCSTPITYSLPIAKSAKKDSPKMNISTAAISNPIPTDQKQRDYLIERLYNIKCAKASEFYTFFKLDPVEGPKTFREFVEKIKSDDFTMDEKRLDQKMSTYSMLDYVRWTKEKPDQAGYDKALAELNKAVQATKDLIVISEPKDGLKALNDFEAKTFH